MEPIHTLDCVPSGVRGNPRYVGDYVIRHYRPLGLAILLRDLGADPSTPELEIIGGIGRLVLRADGADVWEPVPTRKPPDEARPAAIAPLPSDPALAEARRQVCGRCDALREGKCSASGCGCAGEGRPEIWSSRCPLGLWSSV